MKRKKLLEVKNISKAYGKNQVLKDISFDLEEGEVLGILGFSGSGKSTVLNILCGLIKTDSGKVIHYLKENKRIEAIRHFSKEMKIFVGYSTQEPSFYNKLSIEENLIYFARLSHIPKNEIPYLVEDTLDLLELSKYKKILSEDLSGGMKKRLDLACAMIGTPKILVLDEPTESLDYRLRSELLTILEKIKKRGVGIIFVSHMVEEITKISDKVLLLDHQKSKIIKNTKTLKEDFVRYIKND